MPVETATYLSELNASYPAHTDGLSAADSHMRLTKTAIQATFPNFTAAALASTQAQIDAAVAAVVTGLGAGRFYAGTVALPGLTPVGDTNTGFYAPAADQLAASLAGVQALLLTTTALSTALPISAAAFGTSGAYSGGTGQLVPIGATLIWWDDVLPTEGGYAWANGQIIASADTVCPVLLARWGTRFGGNGITTMGVPDLRDTVPVGKSTMGAVASRALHTLTNTVLGTLFGVANQALALANLPPITPAGTIAVTNGTITLNSKASIIFGNTSGSGIGGGGAFGVQSDILSVTQATSTAAFTGTLGGGTSVAVNNVQPSTTCNYIIRLA